MIITPLKPTFLRYFRIFLQSNLSIYRTLLYEELKQIKLSGRLLDFGGGKNAQYFSCLSKHLTDGIYESVNIDPSMSPTYLVGPNEDLPLEKDSFDILLSLNTLEYMYDINKKISYLIRLVKPGGSIVLGVPFLFRTHGANDYQRLTANWWLKALESEGVEEVKIMPLFWDFMVTGLSVTSGVGPFYRLRRLLVPLYGILYANIRSPNSGERYSKDLSTAISNAALGYLIVGVKGSNKND